MSGPKVSAAELKRIKKNEEEKRRLLQALIRLKEQHKRMLTEISNITLSATVAMDDAAVRLEMESLGKVRKETEESLKRIESALQWGTKEKPAELIESLTVRQKENEKVLLNSKEIIDEKRKAALEKKMSAFAAGRNETTNVGDSSETKDNQSMETALNEAKRLTLLLESLIKRAEDVDVEPALAAEVFDEIKRLTEEPGRDGFSVYNDIHRLDLFKIRPFEKEVERKEKEADELDEKLSEELAVYHSLCHAAGITPKKFAFAESSVFEIRYECGKILESMDESSEIRQLMRTVRESLMELGYVYLGEKEEDKKFFREIYRVHDSVILHVIYDSEGKVTMEVAVEDEKERAPHPREVDGIVKEQEKFCDAYERIFDKINEKGVALTKEMMCPVSADFAQVINTSGFDKSGCGKENPDYEMYADRKKKYLYL